MQATDETPSRFEKARAEASSGWTACANNDQMVILQAGANTEVKQSATSEKAALRRALQACACSDGPTRLVPALRMADRWCATSEAPKFICSATARCPT